MTRKTLSILLALVLMLGTFAAAPALATDWQKTSVRTRNSGDTIYIRKGPHKGNTPTLGVVRNGTAIYVDLDYDTDTDDQEDWSRVKVISSGTIGYLKNKYVKYYGLGKPDPVDTDEDDGDYRDADDNDGKRGSGSGASTSTTLQYARVSTSGGALNVRARASASSARNGTARNGERLNILSKSGNWYKVKTARGISGYVSASYVAEGAWAKTDSRVNMRKGAGTGYGVIKTLPSGTSMLVYRKSGNWARVKVGSTYGWVYSTYFSFS